jgi:hypothetical protein
VQGSTVGQGQTVKLLPVGAEASLRVSWLSYSRVWIDETEIGIAAGWRRYSGLGKHCNVWQFWIICSVVLYSVQWAPKALQFFAVSDCLQCGALWNENNT